MKKKCSVKCILACYDHHTKTTTATYPRASRCLLLFFPSSPALAVRFAFAVRPIVTADVVSRDAAAAPCPGWVMRRGLQSIRLGCWGRCSGRSIPRTPRMANVQRTKQAEPVVSRPSGKPPVRYRF